MIKIHRRTGEVVRIRLLAVMGVGVNYPLYYFGQNLFKKSASLLYDVFLMK